MMRAATEDQTTVNAVEFAWLASGKASRWLTELASSELPLHSLVSKLRREFSSTRSHLLLEQAKLRRRAAAKFSQAAQMFLTPRGLEQATDEWISRYKAQRFRDRKHVADLCCGVGGDSIGLAAVSRTTVVDRCAIATFCAGHNAALYRTDSLLPAVASGDVCSINVAEFSAWHLDPDRRLQGRRTTRVELHEPNLTTVEQMLVRQPNGAIKLAPASNLPDHPEWLGQTEFEWISRGGECRQLVAWRGDLTQNVGQRRATSVTDSDATSFTGLPDIPLPVADQVEQYIFEPDAAIRASHLTGALANKLQLQAITAGITYLTSPQPVSDPLLAAFEIVDCMPLDRRKLAAYLRHRGVGQVEIKHRGLRLDPERLRAELKLRGNAAATLIVIKVNGRATVLVTRRLTGRGVT